MKRKKIILTAVVLFIAVLSLFALYSITTVMPHDPTERADQLVLVVSRQESANKAVLHAFVREDGEWRFNFSCPVVIGKNGMAWGRGLHLEKTPGIDEPVKKEGGRPVSKGRV